MNRDEGRGATADRGGAASGLDCREVLGLTRMSLCRWIHGANEQSVESLVPRPKPGRPTTLTPKV